MIRHTILALASALFVASATAQSPATPAAPMSSPQRSTASEPAAQDKADSGSGRHDKQQHQAAGTKKKPSTKKHWQSKPAPDGGEAMPEGSK